jgi:hypothetical protein
MLCYKTTWWKQMCHLASKSKRVKKPDLRIYKETHFCVFLFLKLLLYLKIKKYVWLYRSSLNVIHIFGFLSQHNSCFDVPSSIYFRHKVINSLLYFMTPFWWHDWFLTDKYCLFNRQAWKLGPALATGNCVVMKVIFFVT